MTAATAAAVTAMAVAPAMADPITSHGKTVLPKSYDVVGTGSDTIEYLLDQMMLGYNGSHAKHNKTHPYLYSWDATNPTTGQPGDMIRTKKGCAKIARPDGSSAGILALTSNTKDGSRYCIDFARSSRGRQSTDPAKGPGGVEFVALAKDAVTWATQANSNAPADLTPADLAAIYNCTATTWNQVGGTSTATIKPFLPQIGSGTRAFFLSAIGVSSPGSCVNSSVQENEGTDPQLNDPNAIVPYSIGKWLAEAYHSAKCLNSSCTPVNGKTCKPAAGQNRFGCDVHGAMVLHSIDGTPPVIGTGQSATIDPDFTSTFIRTVYIVVRWANTRDGIPRYLERFFGSKGWACASKAAHKDLLSYGFLRTALCGIGF